MLAAMSAGTACAQGSAQKQGTVYMVSDAHLDTQWNWDVQTTISEYVPKTVRQNLYLLGKYPDYIFNFEGAVKYWWMREYMPTEYEQVKKYIANGRWHLTGSSWDANETVICSPESWLRNVLLGQTFYRQEYGKEGTDIFLPDCFGFPYTMPTLAAHCRLIGFSSQKLGWRTNPFYADGRKYPFPVGLWEGIDGSRIMMTHGYSYGQRFKGDDLSDSEMLKKELKESSIGKIYRYYGTGDTGGSPDIPSVQSVVKGIHGDGPLKIISATSDQIYKDYLPYENHPELPVVKDEMTMDVHGSGCYTSQAAMKLYNRQNEHLGDMAERAAVAAEYLGVKPYPQRQMTATWRQMIWNQFHDALPGTSIPRAYEFAWNDEFVALNRFSSVLASSVGALASKMNTNVGGIPVVLYNSEAYPVQNITEIVLPNMAVGYKVLNAQGKQVASQVVTDSRGKRRLLVDANVPAAGAAVYTVKAAGSTLAATSRQASTVENSVYKVTVDANGNISSLLDKRYNKEMVAKGKSFGLVVFDDCKSYAWPAWEILKATLDKEPVQVKNNVQVALVENGALRKTLKVTRTYGDSKFNQYIRLYEGSQADRIDIHNEVDWHSMNALLKAVFPFSFGNDKATYDLGLGSIKRGNNKPSAYEVYAHEWTDLTAQDGSYGVTILNDSKYGWDKPTDNELRLSLLFSPKADRGYVYQEKQDMGYHEFTYSIVGHKGALDETKTVQKATLLNSPISAFVSPKHKGEIGKEFSFVQSDNANVMVRALKKAEVGNEYVVRVYENAGKEKQTARLTFAGTITKAVEADGTEKEIGAASFAGNTLNVELKPYGVKTYKLTFANKPMNLVQQESVALPYDRKCFSPNGFRNQANFEGGYSYAAELLPDDGITVDNVHFAFGEKDGVNGLTCKGNVVKLPAGNKYNRLYVLAASDSGDRTVRFTVGKTTRSVLVPNYTGFIGQWGHEGQTEGFYKDAEVAYVGTHRHSASKDEPYEFTYMFKYAIDLPKGATEVTLPNDEHVVIFSATLANEPIGEVAPASTLFRTNNKGNALYEVAPAHVNLLDGAKVLAASGHTNAQEKPENLVDGDKDTKWCDTSSVPTFVAFDLGEAKTVSGWQMLNAGAEDASYITRTCLLQGRTSEQGEWKTLDVLDGNKANLVKRTFKPQQVRYLRLYVIGSEQRGSDATRIYELEVF